MKKPKFILHNTKMVKLKTLFLFPFLVVCLGSTLEAQTIPSAQFIGINPSVTLEPFYEKGELDVNIAPFVYQRSLGARMDLRMGALVNLGIRKKGNGISHFGVETALPWFLKKKSDKAQNSMGFYLAPIVSLSRNLMEEHNNLGFWVEPGYHLLFESGFAISFGIQTGGTYFVFDTGQKEWKSHFGIKVILGLWL
ncbi:MAG: hypothetical protein IPM48_01715 [Saprospiraceae bacterium]|nr:hypothetical protein [Saprospiraceae bacterium]